MSNGWKICVMSLVVLMGCTTGRQTMLGQEGVRGQLDRERRAGFSSTSKTKIVTTNQYPVDIDQDMLKNHDPNQVLDVRIIGNFQIGAKDIVKIIKTKKGRPFNETTLEEDKRALMQKGWFIDVKPKVEKTPAGYIVTLQFIERPILHYIRIIGNKAHTRKILMEEANIKPGDALDPIAVHQARERMEQFYRDSGYYQVNIEVLTGDEIGDRGAVFVVSEGPKQKIRDTQFEGNHIASSARLKTQIQSKPGWFFKINSEFTRKQLDEDVETLTTYYRKLGFFYAKIDRKFVERTGNKASNSVRKWVDVKFVIDEGPRCRVGDVRFIGQKIFNQEQLHKMMKLPKEKYFNQDMLETDMNRIKDAYGEIGYVFARAEPDPRIDEDYVDLVIDVKEGPRCKLGSLKVEIVGNEGADPYTKWHPVLNRLSLRPGDILSTKEINASKRRLMASQLFNTNPMQGQVPDIIFEYPEEANEDEERAAEAQADATPSQPRIRGQVGKSHRLVPVGELFRSEPVDMEKKVAEPFLDYFKVRVPQRQSPPSSPNSLPTTRYQPMQTPVEPMNLDSLRPDQGDTPEFRHRFEPGEDLYRGQQFVRPNVGSTSPSYVAQAGYVAPAGNGSLGSVTPVTHLSGYTPVQNQPANIQMPSGYVSTGGYTVPSTVSNTPVQTHTYSPPLPETASISVAQHVPTAQFNAPAVATYPAPQSGLAGSNTAHPGTGIVLGNTAVDSAIGNSAYGFDTKNPTTKIYSTDGTVRIQETRTGQLMMSVAVSSDSGLMGRFIIEEQNFDILNLPKGWKLKDWKNAFRGKGQRFRIEACPGTDVQRYSTSWETPHLFNLDYSFGVSGFYYERYYDEWYEDRIGGSVSFGKLWTPDFTTRLSLGAQQVKLYRPIYPTPTDLAAALGSHPMYTIGFEANHNTRDSDFMPTEGHMASFYIEQVLGDYEFVRGNIDLRKYFTLHERPDRSGRWVLGLRSSLGISEKGTPIYERYFGGGFTSMRGFEFRGMSPRDENGIIVGGCMEFYNSAELVFPITADDMIRGSFFVDSGTVERSISHWESNYRVSVGFGLRLTIPMMGPAPIALDFAFPISKQRGDEKQVFSFNVGFMR